MLFSLRSNNKIRWQSRLSFDKICITVAQTERAEQSVDKNLEKLKHRFVEGIGRDVIVVGGALAAVASSFRDWEVAAIGAMFVGIGISLAVGKNIKNRIKFGNSKFKI